MFLFLRGNTKMPSIPPFPPQKKKAAAERISATTVLFPCSQVVHARCRASSYSIIVDLLACALGGLRPLRDIPLPSQFPNGRLTARVMHSCTYSNVYAPDSNRISLFRRLPKAGSLYAKHDAAYEFVISIYTCSSPLVKRQISWYSMTRSIFALRRRTGMGRIPAVPSRRRRTLCRPLVIGEHREDSGQQASGAGILSCDALLWDSWGMSESADAPPFTPPNGASFFVL